MAEAKMKFKINIKKIEEEVQEIIKKHENIIKEKIAFSLFIMFYYKYNFCFEPDKYLTKIKLKEAKQMWKLGKIKNKLKNFFSLADQIFKMNLINNDKKENVNDNN